MRVAAGMPQRCASVLLEVVRRAAVPRQRGHRGVGAVDLRCVLTGGEHRLERNCRAEAGPPGAPGMCKAPRQPAGPLPACLRSVGPAQTPEPQRTGRRARELAWEPHVPAYFASGAASHECAAVRARSWRRRARRPRSTWASIGSTTTARLRWTSSRPSAPPRPPPERRAHPAERGAPACQSCAPAARPREPCLPACWRRAVAGAPAVDPRLSALAAAVRAARGGRGRRAAARLSPRTRRHPVPAL